MDIAIPSFSDYARSKLEEPVDAEIIEEVSRPDVSARIIKEWRCLGHSYFESTTPICPHGCTTVERAFLTAPSIRTTNGMTNADRLQDQLARAHGLSDMRTPEIGQTMSGKMNPQPVSIARPTSLSEVLELGKQGINTGTVTVPIGRDMAPAVAQVAAARTAFSDLAPIDATAVAQNGIRKAKVYNQGNARPEIETVQKMATE